MIEFEQRNGSLRSILTTCAPPALACCILGPIVKSYGWVFFYQSEEYLLTGEFDLQLSGNAPVLVERHTGNLITFGTAHSMEHYFSEYERLHGILDEADRPKAEASMPVRTSLTDGQVSEVVAALRQEFPLAWQQLVEAERSPFGFSLDCEVAIQRAIRSLCSRWPFIMQAPEPLWLLLDLDQRVLEIAGTQG